MRDSTRVLLVEDNKVNQKVFQLMLKRLGYKADVASNGLEALKSMEGQRYDAVLMDIQMPEMDGLEATRIIRQQWPEDGPRIIAVTAFASLCDEETCFEAGMDDYLSKPVRMEDLKSALLKIHQP